MEGYRFDRFSRGIARRFSRRRAIGGLGVSGAAGVMGIARRTGNVAVARAAQDDDVCVLDFRAAVRLGPSQGERRGGEWVGELRFTLDSDGEVSGGSLLLEGDDDGDALPVTGQATGSAVTFRIEVDADEASALVAVGAGERDVARCRGTFSGLLAGPLPGDIGDWSAAPPDPDAADEPDEPVEQICDQNDMLDCEIGCEEGDLLTYDCSCVTTGSAVCDVSRPEPQVLTDDCECVCLQ